MDNEHILRIAEESGMTQYVAANNKFLERFAHQIIAECLNVIHTNKRCPDGFIGSHEAGFQLGCNRSIENIKQHFGIK